MKNLISEILIEMENELKSKKVKRFSPEATCVTRKTPSLPAKYLVNYGLVENKKILNFGSGRSVDSQYFLKNGATRADDYDYFYNNKLTNLNPQLYDLVVAFYVLNVVVFQEQIIIAKTIKKLIKPNGSIAIAVREDHNTIKPNWKRFGRGFITSKGTYQEFFHPTYNKGMLKLKNLFNNSVIRRIGRSTYLISKVNSFQKKECR
ncbi:MAG: hypothetical protein ACTSVK_02110 [Promethearchaeota archaeon]